MNEEIFAVLQDSLSLLNDEEAINKLQQIKQRYDEKLYFVAFVGQFSAGKSSLLNNLLGRSILPQGTMETTPILTYIRYGEEEKAILYYNDGSESELAIEEVKQIMQKGTNHSEVSLSEIEHMEIYLQAEILKQGMVLLDTPGINTLIERHEQLLANTLALASNIVYVTGHSLSKFDAEKLSEMISHGFPISFVRTHCDEINELEESYEQVRSKDIKTLKSVLSENKATLDEKRCFHISNQLDSKYFGMIDDIKKMLELNGQDVRKSLTESTQQQIAILKERTVNRLEELQSMLKVKKDNQGTELKKHKNKLNEDMQALSIKLGNLKDRLNRDIEKCCKNFKSDIQGNIDSIVKAMPGKIMAANVHNNEDMRLFLQKETRLVLQRMMKSVNGSINPILRDINGEFKDETIAIDFADLPEIENYTGVIQAQNFEVEELRRQFVSIQHNRKQLEENLVLSQNTPELLEMQKELESLEQELASLKNEQAGMIYEPQMIEVAGDQTGSQLGKKIGNIVDWALIFLPQATVLKAAQKVGVLGKIATTTTKVGKYANAIANGLKKGKSLNAVISNVRGVTKTYKTLKRIEQVKNVIQTGAKTLNVVKEAAPATLLDYLTVEHWGEQLGKQFDSPPRLEEDKVYRHNFEVAKQQLIQDIKSKQEKIYQRKLDMKIFRNKQEQEKARLESLRVNETELKQKLEAQENEFQSKAKTQATTQWKQAWSDYYCLKLHNNLEEYFQAYLDELPARLNSYQDKRFQLLQDKFNEKKQQYDELNNMSTNDVDDKLNCIDNLIGKLKN